MLIMHIRENKNVKYREGGREKENRRFCIIWGIGGYLRYYPWHSLHILFHKYEWGY